MELQSGVSLVIQQYKALLVKNFILARRNWRPAIIQLFSSLIFLFLIFCIDKAIAARAAASARGGAAPIFSPAIPRCETKFFAQKPCFDFVWSGSSSPRIAAIVQSIMRNNPGRPISGDRVMAFRTPDDVDVWLAQNPLRCPGALHFVDRNSTVISYGIQTNSTQVDKRGTTENPTFKFQIPLQIAAEREISRFFLGDPNFSWDVGFKEYPHPVDAPIVSAMQIAGPTFFLSMAMFGFVFQISSLVTEKELKLRQAMTMMGLYETAYWLSWLTWETFLTLLSALLTVIFGMMFGFDFFRHNNFMILFLTFFLFQLNMVGFAFMISAFVRKSSSATTVGFTVFIAGFGTQIGTLIGFPSADAPLRYRLWFLFPPNLLAKALKLLSDGTATSEDRGISWRNRGKCAADDDPCVMTIEGAFIWLITTFFLWFILAIYLDNIIPNANGVRKPVLYFLNLFYWTGKGGNKVKEGSLCSCVGSIPSFDEVTPDDEDVLAEETAVKQQATQSEIDPNIAVQIRGLKKTYPGTTSIGCCKCKRSKPFHAVKGLWVNFAKDQLFCLLGPNGAGKTTTISCLTGITPVTGGDALIYGYSVRSSVDMSNIRRIIGVCPQFDILWDALTAQEHLRLFSSIKGLHPSVIKSVVEKSLDDVKLTGSARVRAGSYSGGMKRRLSVAVALIGDPKMVFLDEPTTGMDPINRRHVWDIIEDAKKGRAIVLTTHSMEEADILGDRIAIMAKGRLRCIGTSIRLKSRFGSGYITNVSFLVNTTGDPPVEPVKQFFKNYLDVKPKEESKTLLTFVIPREKEGLLTNFFAELQDREREFGISDIQLGLTTLEEVFLNIAQQAELENSASEESFVTLSLSSGASIQIPKGARYVGIPGTATPENPRGLMVEVYWVQDESGNLCISGHSDEVPLPPSVQLDVYPPRNSVLGGGSPMVGFSIDSRQVQGGQ